MRIFRRKRNGQAATEAMLSIPVMCLVFAIGCTLFNITFNAQYAHVKARKKLMDSAEHMPCKKGDGSGGVRDLSKFEERAFATTDARNFVGIGRMDQPQRTMTAKSVIVCKNP